MPNDVLAKRAPRPRSRRAVVVVAVALLGGAVDAAPASASPTWSITASPSPPGPPAGTLNAVACAGANVCWAVSGGPAGATLFQRWNGTGWSVAPSPQPGGVNVVTLAAVACPSTTNCWAVGSASSPGHRTLVEHWNGSAWSVVASPNPAGSVTPVLSGVSCPSTASCWAVGERLTTSGEQTLVEHWNGSAWSIVASPNRAGANASVLAAVACPSANVCLAVGHNSSSSGDRTLVERWNGTSWSIVTSPNPSGATAAQLAGVSCPATADCTAVGRWSSSTGDRTLVERWDGTSWSVVASPNPVGTTMPALSAVSCASATSCNAVGSATATSVPKTLAEHWDGTSWSIVASPNGRDTALLLGIACPGANRCFAAGSQAQYTLVEQWNGTTWSIAAPPSGSSQSQLSRVACVTATSCFAVGAAGGSIVSTLIEHWNGSSWAKQPSPVPAGAIDAGLGAVACTGATNCWAVGHGFTTNAARTLIERWNGTTWSIFAGPTPAGAASPALLGVACASASSCWAVGTTAVGGGGRTLVEHWDGTSWSIVASPNPAGASSADLSGVSCPAAGSCTAVGHNATATTGKVLIERWNGTSWSIVAAPNPSGAAIAGLSDVTCTATTACWAVGRHSSSSGNQTLVERWNGSAWSIVTSPDPAGVSFAGLDAVACASSTSCWAVGKDIAADIGATLVEHWNGSAWSVVASPNPAGAVDSTLTGVACPGPSTCYAAGNAYFLEHEIDDTLAERLA